MPNEDKISIHAPRVGGDIMMDDFTYAFYISIHAPRVGGDYLMLFCNRKYAISIHAPRVGGDGSNPPPAPMILKNFNPRPPCGGRL